MFAEVHTSAFRFVVEGLMGGEALVPGLRERVTALPADGWAPWADYVAACQALAEVVTAATMRRVGAEVMIAAREHLVAQGFASADAALASWPALFDANVRGLSPDQRPIVRDHAQGHLVIDYGVDLPAPLVEGFLRGVVLAFGGRVRRFEAIELEVDGVPRLRCELRWSPGTA
jgi:hypothetical protein